MDVVDGNMNLVSTASFIRTYLKLMNRSRKQFWLLGPVMPLFVVGQT